MKVRKASFAGSWYPGSASACKNEIDTFLQAETYEGKEDRIPIGGITPHAGWYFSGAIACKVIHGLSAGEAPDVVVIFGMHLPKNAPAFIMPEGSWETPFGVLPVNEQLGTELVDRFQFRVETPEMFNRDNTIELQLPFVKYFFKDSTVLTIGTPPTEKGLEIGEAVADICHSLGLSAKIIGSTDLTHYGPNYGFIPKGKGQAALDWVQNENDREAIDEMVRMNPHGLIQTALKNHNACCPGAAAAAIAAARKLGAEKAESVMYGTSFDKSPGDSFVGYVGVIMTKQQ